MNQKNASPCPISTLSPLYGLVLNGGNSMRMKQGKSMLRYHGKIQLAHAFELLSAHCKKVFVSNRKGQAHLQPELPQIHDTYQNLGPVSGILSAMTAFPDVAWLVLANDMPYVDDDAIHTLIRHRNPLKTAVAYQNPQRDFPEPLCTIYEPIMRIRLLEFLDSGGRFFRIVLEHSDVRILEPPQNNTLINVNYPEEYQQVIKSLRAAQHC
jgi:molybdopterin-guanine dinucleotide biosynthesis protein A